MSIKLRLTIMNFLQFFVWGAWLLSIGTYCMNTKGWTGAQFGAIFSTMGFASIFMPTLMGIIADRWINTEKLYGILHILYGLVLLLVPKADTPDSLFYTVFLAMIFYMPTIALSYSISYTGLRNANFDVLSNFPKIRTWGTIGFFIAMWLTNLTKSNVNANQFYIAAISAIALGIYSFSLPKCPPDRTTDSNSTFFQKLGLSAFNLFKDYKMAVFFIFSFLIGCSLQLSNMYADSFLMDFGAVDKYKDSFVVNNSLFVVSLSQIFESIFLITIPFFLRKFGIKKVIIFSMLAWVLRFWLFSIGNPGGGFIFIFLSCVVYGLAFDFFNVSGSLFIERNTDQKIRSSAQGLFMLMTNGIGAVLGSLVSGWAIDKFFTIGSVKQWSNIWFTFGIYPLVLAILFFFLFKHKHNPSDFENVKH
jgi:NHS family xanthosine MFS transporter